ncbi:MAG: hemin uptake protein HemP [Nitrospinota bacterium]
MKDGAAAPRAVLIGVGFVAGGKPVVESSELFGGASSLIIRHEGSEYCLERTRSGKLLLKK